MTDIIATVVFVGFLATAALTRLHRNRRRAVNVFILWALGGSFLAGLSQRDLWPFSAWPLIAGVVPSPVVQHRIVALDRRGAEHPIDHRAWYPLSYEELVSWVETVFVELDDAQRTEAAAHLVQVVEGARLRAVETGRVGRFDRFLGPFTAPFFLLKPRYWTDGPPPPEPIVGLRFIRETWEPELLAAGADSVRREPVYTFLAR